MKQKIVRCAAAVTLAVPLAAFAMTFDNADANRDGMVSRSEWNAAAAGPATTSKLPARDIEERSKGMVHKPAKAASGGSTGVSVATPPLPQRDIEERSKGLVHERTPAAQAGGRGVSVERPPLPQRDIEERSKGLVHERTK